MPLGTQNLEKVIDLGLAFAKQTMEVMEDKKVKLLELTKYLDELLMIPGVASAWPDIKAEWADGLDDADRERLHARFSQKFDIPNDEVEFWIEDALLNISSLISLINRFAELKKKKNAEQ